MSALSFFIWVFGGAALPFYRALASKLLHPDIVTREEEDLILAEQAAGDAVVVAVT